MINKPNIKTRATVGPIWGINQATIANPKKGTLSKMVNNITIGLYRFCWDTL
jgi:hypothetical protein